MDNSVEVRYAGVVVGRGAIVKDLGVGSAGSEGLDAGSGFVGIPEPLPVGTLVSLKMGDAVHEARVDDVVESSEPTAVGMRVSWGGAPGATAPAPRVVAPPLAPPPAVAAAPAPPPVVAVAPSPPPVVAVAPAPPEALSSAIPAPLSLAGPSADGSHQGGGKKRRKRR